MMAAPRCGAAIMYRVSVGASIQPMKLPVRPWRSVIGLAQTVRSAAVSSSVRDHSISTGVVMGLFSTHAKSIPTEQAPIVGPIITMRGLEKVFELPAGRMYVLRRINVDVQPGEFISIMGPSGAGKSTLLSILGMLDSA